MRRRNNTPIFRTTIHTGQIDDGYDLGDLPQLYVDLSEYVVRASRLYLQIRECSIHAIDRDKFEALLSRKPEFSQAG